MVPCRVTGLSRTMMCQGVSRGSCDWKESGSGGEQVEIVAAGESQVMWVQKSSPGQRLFW